MVFALFAPGKRLSQRSGDLAASNLGGHDLVVLVVSPFTASRSHHQRGRSRRRSSGTEVLPPWLPAKKRRRKRKRLRLLWFAPRSELPDRSCDQIKKMSLCRFRQMSLHKDIADTCELSLKVRVDRVIAVYFCCSMSSFRYTYP